MIKSFKKISFLFFLLIIGSILNAQDEKTVPVVSRNYDAQSFFIEGKTLEMEYKLIPALENYKTALKFDKAPGIYFAIANIYYNLGKYQDATYEINNALKLVPDEIKYLELKREYILQPG